jgi:hypothetical protein
MSISAVGRRGRLVLAAGAIAAALALPGVALADTTDGPPSIQPAFSRDATIQSVKVSVSSKLIATVTIVFTCNPLQQRDWDTGEAIDTTDGHVEGGGATILQAQGRTVDWGQSELFGQHAVCDGATLNTVSTTVTPVLSPWRNGTAVVGASVYVIDENGSDADYASTGPITVKLGSK